MFEIADHPITFRRPRRLTTLSAWVEHIPFAFLLVDLARPDLLVELGTHAGDSYCAFLQGVQELGLPTRCFAVDTWEGDEHAGHYGNEVFEDLTEHHAGLYSGFSSLIRSTFDAALEHFEDSTVDVLHIDGLHTYEAVRHDFEKWLPKMSSRGLVLLHDTNVREGDFGVWRLWAELASRYPSFEFSHGHGLGVLAVGSAEPPGFLALREAIAAQPTISTLFSELGFRLQLQVDTVLAKQHAGALEVALADLRHEVARLAQVDADRHAAIMTLRGEVAEAQAGRERAEAALSGALAELNARDARLADQGAALISTRHHAEVLEQTVSAERATLGYRVLKSAREGVRKVAPKGTNRRGLLFFASRSTRAWIEAGPGAVRTSAADRWLWPPRLMDATRAAAPPAAGDAAVGLPFEDQYQVWLQLNALTPGRLRKLQRELRELPYQPTVSIVMPAYRSDLKHLAEAIESVRAQVYRRWELCIADDASGDADLRRLLRRYRLLDRRIKVTTLKRNQGIAGASQAALEMATGEFVGLLDHDDVLTLDALAEVVLRLSRDQELDYIYTDEDKLEADGRRVSPFFKPDWSPDLLRSMNYLNHFSVYRRSMLQSVGGFRPGYDGSQDYDLALRVTDATDRVAHIAKPLYSWRKTPGSAAAVLDAKPYAFMAAKRALRDHLARQGIEGSVENGSFLGSYRTRYALEGTPSVAIIIPTRDRVELLRQAIDSIQERSTYSNYEIIVVDNGSHEEETLEYLDSFGGRVMHHPGEFNFSRLVNLAAQEAKADAVLLLNNDTEVITPDWMEALLDVGMRPGVGAAGARLLFPGGRVQHEGVLLGVGGDAINVDHNDYFGLGRCIRNVGAVTAACMLIPASVFGEMGGFDERLQVAFNDVDFCLRVRQKGYRIVYTPFAVLTHHESASRGSLHPPEDTRIFRERWGEIGECPDPYYNVNLSANYPYKIRVESS